MSVTTQQAPKLPFTRLGEFEVLALISEGGMAAVYLGRPKEQPERVVALKVIRPELARNKEFIAMFLDEARIASRFAHPNVVSMHGLGHDGKRHFLVMELLRGRTLLEVWEAAHARGLRLPHAVVAWLGARVASALHYVHEYQDEKGNPQHVVHRDINPSNIFVTFRGEPKVIDFGLARAKDRITSTATGFVKGKLAYLAPEQAQGKTADRRADIFALGVTLWEVSADRRLFKEGSDVETVRRVLQAEVPDPRTVVEGYPPELAAILMRALARDPNGRFRTAKDFATALDGFAARAEARPDPPALKRILAELFPAGTTAPWEVLVGVNGGSHASGPPSAPPPQAGDSDRVAVWDDDAQKMTWMQMSVESPGEPNDRPSQRSSRPAPVSRQEQIDRAIVERLAGANEPLATARGNLERALVDELLGDGSRAAEYAEESLKALSTTAAHAIRRRVRHARDAAKTLLEDVEAEIDASASDAERADRLAEKARLLEVAGAPSKKVLEAWASALAAVPAHPAALKGLESALGADPSQRARLVEHLARMADAYGSEPKLSAWLHVERAACLDGSLGQTDAARAALAKALEIDGAPGPVREACLLHAAAHRDSAWLATLLSQEADLDGVDANRAARCLLDAACLARHRLGDEPRALALLERAAARAPTSPMVDRRVLDELVALHSRAGRIAEEIKARRARLSLMGDVRLQANELRAISTLREQLGDREGAIEDVVRARAASPDDVTLFEQLDRLLDAGGRQAERIELWAREGARAEVANKRTRLLVRAASLAEAMGNTAAALDHLRAALAVSPAHASAVEGLTRLLALPRDPAALDVVRDRISVLRHAAEHAADPPRRIAYLEPVALLEEEVLGDAATAAATYESILRLEPGRRSALSALTRVAARTGDAGRLASALLEEARHTTDGGSADDLRVRAAEALAPTETERALGILEEVLARVPAHDEARAVQQRVYEEAERWGLVVTSITARLEHVSERERVDLLLARAAIERVRVHAPLEGLASLRKVLKLDPLHPAARDALIAILEELGDARGLRDGLLELASSATGAEQKASALVRAAEIDELVLLDDAHAATVYGQALALVPNEPWIEQRRSFVLRRLGREAAAGELEHALEARNEAHPSPEHAFDLALVLLEGARDVPRATALVDAILKDRPGSAHALRTLERIGRETGAAPLVANALAQQADAFTADVPRLGALWAEAQLVEWTLPGGDASSIYASILELAPADRAALDAAVRVLVPKARGGDDGARDRLVAALRSRLSQAPGESDVLAAHLALALALDRVEGRSAQNPGAREALAHYREALRIDPKSAVAALGAARLGVAVGDAEATVAAAMARAELVAEPKRSAVFLTQAAGQLLSSSDERLGSRAQRLERAGELLERALLADPESLGAVGVLVTVRAEQVSRDRLVVALRGALERARMPDVIVALGGELARAACMEPPDRELAIDALRRVERVAPTHLPTLRSLADVLMARGASADAAEVLERFAQHAREPNAKLNALFELTELYSRVLVRPLEAERSLRTALDVDPGSVRALRQLVELRRAAEAPQEELAAWLARLGDAETTSEGKSAVFAELAELRWLAGDASGAERALVEAAAQAARPVVLARLVEIAGAPAEQARALERVVARAEELERPDARCLATLGRLEIDLGRYDAGVGHLRAAIAVSPTMHEARAALAKGLTRRGATGEALSVMIPMLVPDAAPLLSLGDPADALGTLENALHAEGKPEEAVVARELRVIAGGLDDAAHVELRARRLSYDPGPPPAILFDRASLRASLVPTSAADIFLEVAAALSGVEGKLARTDLEELGVTPRDRLAPTSGHPLALLLQRLARMLGVDRPELAASDQVAYARAAAVGDSAWILVPPGLSSQPEPMQAAALARALVRVSLGLHWTEELPTLYTHAVLLGAVRQVVPDFGSELRGLDHDLVADYTRRVGRAIGRRQKKLLSERAAQLASTPPPTVEEVEALLLDVGRAEFRAAFVVTGDLLVTFDALRAMDPPFERDTAAVGSRALLATLSHPVASDVARFALSAAATGLRWRAGSLWGGRS